MTSKKEKLEIIEIRERMIKSFYNDLSDIRLEVYKNSHTLNELIEKQKMLKRKRNEIVKIIRDLKSFK